MFSGGRTSSSQNGGPNKQRKRKRGNGLPRNAGRRTGTSVQEDNRLLHVFDFATSRRRDIQELMAFSTVVDAATQSPTTTDLKSLADRTLKLPRHLRRRAASHTRYNSLPIGQRRHKEQQTSSQEQEHQPQLRDDASRTVKRRQWWIRSLQYTSRPNQPQVSKSSENATLLRLPTHVWHAKRFKMKRPPASWGTLCQIPLILLRVNFLMYVCEINIVVGPWLSLPWNRADRSLSAAVEDSRKRTILHDESYVGHFQV